MTFESVTTFYRKLLGMVSSIGHVTDVQLTGVKCYQKNLREELDDVINSFIL